MGNVGRYTAYAAPGSPRDQGEQRASLSAMLARLTKDGYAARGSSHALLGHSASFSQRPFCHKKNVKLAIVG